MSIRHLAVAAALGAVLFGSGCVGPPPAAQPTAAVPSPAPPATMNAAQQTLAGTCTTALAPLLTATGSTGVGTSNHTALQPISGGDGTTGVTCLDALALPAGDSGQATRHAAVAEAHVQPVTAAVQADKLQKAFFGLCRAGGGDALPQPLDGRDTALGNGLSVYEWPQTATLSHQPRCYFYQSATLLLHVKVTVLFPNPKAPSAEDLKKGTAAADAYAAKLVELAKG
ncbi:hypothetical protein AB0M43_18060 [Longispora sp. NPDC051575]|uniref:hypothetical protein n=1 Tax=Longispora sp. NPDC051575 TaxID=3154943 RepID=UPI00343BA1CB